MEIDIKARIKGAKIVSKTFTPEGGQPIAYKQLILQVILNGNLTDIPVKINADKALILEAAADQDKNLLDPQI